MVADLESGLIFEAEELKDFLAGLLTSSGANHSSAQLCADMYIRAELSGLGSHGVMRLIRILDGIQAGTHFPHLSPTIVRENASTALLDGHHGLGVPSAMTAMRLAVKKAEETGLGCVGLKNSTHFGLAGYYAEYAALNNMIGIALCNTQPAIAPGGGRKKIIGTNPIAIAVPAGEYPLVLDMSMSAVSRGYVLEAARRGQTIIENSAVDENGIPTTRPEQALKGALLAFGGKSAYKAFGLAFMVDVLCGPLVGAAFADEVKGTADTTSMCTKGDLFLALNIESFRDPVEFKTEVTELAAKVNQSGTNVLLPGEKEQKARLNSGGLIRLDVDIIQRLKEEGGRTGHPLPRTRSEDQHGRRIIKKNCPG